MAADAAPMSSRILSVRGERRRWTRRLLIEEVGGTFQIERVSHGFLLAWHDGGSDPENIAASILRMGKGPVFGKAVLMEIGAVPPAWLKKIDAGEM